MVRTLITLSLSRRLVACLALAGFASAGAGPTTEAKPAHSAAAEAPQTPAALLEYYCYDCHDSTSKKGGLALDEFDVTKLSAHPDLWEKVVRKLVHRQMPPIGKDRPEDAVFTRWANQLVAGLDQAAAQHPNPGRTDTFRRLTRTEYQNAVRDLLGVEVDATLLLPNDEPSHGFDNVTVGNLSPTLLDRYVSAAEKIARLAVGTPRKAPGGDTFRVPPDVTQEQHIEGLPIGTRGGALFPYEFPQDGTYEFQIRLARDRNEQVEGLRKPHDVEVLIDRERVGLFTVKPPGEDKNAEGVDAHLKLRVPVKAGPHGIGVTFPKNPTEVIETERRPFLARFNMHRHPRTAPAVYQVSVTGPFDATGPGDTPSRRLLFGTQADFATLSAADQEKRAREILKPVVRRAYRRPVTDADLERLLQFFRDGRDEGGFETGIDHALSAILVSPRFLIRVESDPTGLPSASPYSIDNFELASRLSFFLWSSLPDDALLDSAERGDLRRPDLLEKQVRRMLADPRSRSLVTNFATQWLQLRKLDAITPDLRLFPDFDDNLRQAFREETELFVESVLQEDRSITDLLSADYTFVNERLAKHYGIPNVYGSRFRRISFAGDTDRQRGGLLRQGSVLTVTSYATRTSPVIRGHYILANLAGEPPPPPPPNVPALDDNTVSATLPMRERLAAHRSNPTCASCHNVMDPVGFALENFDAVGHWRNTEERRPIDVAGGLPDGSKFQGVAGLEQGLLQRPDLFAGTLAEKLLIFALGRGIEPSDAPAVRQIVRRAQADNYRFSSLLLGVVTSTPFQMRKSP